MIVGVSVMIDSFRSTVGDWLDTTLGADIYIARPGRDAPAPTLTQRSCRCVAAVAGVDHVVTGRNVSVTAPDYPDLPPVSLNVADGEIVSGPRRFAWNTAGADYLPALDTGKIMVSEPFAFRRGITQEHNTLTLLTDRGAQTFEVVGVYYDYTSDQGSVFMTRNVYHGISTTRSSRRWRCS
ncbi:MAG: hypothetical protein U0521_06820 [Anaerolineae bacterium]